MEIIRLTMSRNGVSGQFSKKLVRRYAHFQGHFVQNRVLVEGAEKSDFQQPRSPVAIHAKVK